MRLRFALILSGISLSLMFFVLPARAVGIKISSEALERTLHKQLFTADGRYYIKGKPGSACYVYAEDPKVTFHDDRVWVHLKTHSKLGTSIRGACLGVSLSAEADVSLAPDAEGETIGFRDVRIEHLNTSKELNIFLVPFLNGKLPQKMQLNAADLLRQALSQSANASGYTITLDDLKIQSMQVDHNLLNVDFDGNLSVH